MRQFKIRDMDTGDVLTREGANAVEILAQKDRFVVVGSEPKGWKPKTEKVN